MIARVLVVDDEPLAREHLAHLVRQAAPEATVTEAANGDEAVAMISAARPDVVFLDIQMPGRTGLEVIEHIGAERMPAVVFVTAYDQHAVRAFDVAAVDYLLKPYHGDRFLEAWRRVVARHAAESVVTGSRELLAALDAARSAPHAAAPGATIPADADATRLERIAVTDGLRTRFVRLADVEWLEADGNHVRLHAGGVVHRIRDQLSHLEPRLDPARFVRIHRSTIVALDAIKELQPWYGGDQVLILRDGKQLRVSRALRARLVSRLTGGR
ncbi:MAG: response regulator transcription factor [Gemmatimonadetes bacterium]|nr:response regulator transcription factor [Gemmatimonadota bacterium]